MQKGKIIAGYLSFTLFCGNSMFYSSAPKVEVPLGRVRVSKNDQGTMCSGGGRNSFGV